MSKTVELARHLEKLHINNMYKTDFYWTWDKTDDEIDAVFTVADALRDLRERNKSTKVFNSGLGISLFRDNSTRTRFSFASACNLLGLEEQVLDEKKSQIAHGETVRETANMVSFMADVIGIRDDMYIHQGHEYQKTFMDALEEGYRDGILEQRPTLVNLQCDVDHPTQCMADMLHVIHYFGGVENLKGKKVAMTWAYSPSYGKPLSVPQGVIGLFTRFGMDVTLAHPEGYDVFPEVEEIARKNCEKYGSKFHKTNDMKEAFKDADIVYPKSWAPFQAMERRSELYVKGDQKGIDELEKELLAQNAEHKDWTCSEEMMKLTKDGKALYLHCLPADISGLSCPEPVSSMVQIGTTQGLRYLHCNLCETEWHVVRVKCSNCEQSRDLNYWSLDNEQAAIKAESCGDCGTYLKILYQEKDPKVEAVADDLASLMLDAHMEQEGFARSSINPFLFPGEGE